VKSYEQIPPDNVSDGIQWLKLLTIYTYHNSSDILSYYILGHVRKKLYLAVVGGRVLRCWVAWVSRGI